VEEHIQNKSYHSTGFSSVISNNKPTRNNVHSCSSANNYTHNDHLPIADTGASDSYIRTSDTHLITRYINSPPIPVQLPNGAIIHSNGSGYIDLPAPLTPILVHVFSDNDLHRSLISISDFANQDCQIRLTNTSIKIFHSDNLILSGSKTASDKLWTLDLSEQPKHVINQAIHNQHTAVRVAYWHRAMGCPSLRTFTNAITNKFIQLPNLDSAMVHANPSVIKETQFGHMKLIKQGLQSTKNAQNNPPQVPPPNEANSSYLCFHTIKISDIQHVDLTGRLPKSAKGNEYIFIATFNGYICLVAQKSRSTADYIKSTREIHSFFKEHLKTALPKVQRQDNETSAEWERVITQELGMTIEYVSPGNHRTLVAERAIQTAANHLVSIWAATDEDFPVRQLWDLTLAQAELTLNLLQPYLPNPTISAYEGIHGKKYDFLAHPIAPIGCKVIVHDRADQRPSWSNHGSEGFYIGPALKHYRNFQCYMKHTGALRITDTVSWLLEPTYMPGSTPSEIFQAAITDCSNSIKNIARHVAPNNIDAFHTINNQLTSNLKQFHELFHPTSDIPPTPDNIPITNTDMPNQRVLEPAPIQRVLDIIPDVPVPPVLPINNPIPAVIDVAPAEIVGRSQRMIPSDSFQNLPPPIQPVAIEPPIVTNDRPIQHGSRLVNSDALQNLLEINHIEKPICYNYANNTVEFITPTVNTKTFPNIIRAESTSGLTYRTAMKGPQSEKWKIASSEEFIRLIETTNTMEFVHHNVKPVKKLASFYNPQIKVKVKNGEEVFRVRGTYGGNLSDYEGDASAWTTNMTTLKIFLNTVISEDAEWMTADIVDFYLGTPLPEPEYMRIHKDQIPENIFNKYYLQHLIQGNHVMVKIHKGIYGLKQAGKLAQDRLFEHLNKHGYKECPNTPCLFIHESRPVSFCSVVDDFGVKYKGKENADHLLDTLKKLYQITEDWSGSKYVGLTININRAAKTLTLSMPGYVAKALKRFNVIKSKHNTDSPLIYTPPHYGVKQQQSPTPDDSSPLLPEDMKKYVQQVVGVFLYYARAIDNTMLTAISKISSTQSAPTEDTLKAIQRLLQYAATWPDAEIVYHASKLIYFIHSDASHLSDTNSRSRSGSYHMLHNGDGTINAPILCSSIIIPTVCGGAYEAEYAALYINGCEGVSIRNTLSDLGYPQEPTIIITDNTVAQGIANNTLTQKKSKAIEMRYHWIQERVRMGLFKVIWKEGKNNLADFFTKAHPVHHHKDMRKFYVHTPKDDNNIRGSANAIQRRKKYLQNKHNSSSNTNINTTNNKKHYIIPTHNRFTLLDV